MERKFQRKALDVLAYFRNNILNIRGLVHDTAALATEIGKGRDVSARIWQVSEARVGDHVINFPVNKDVDIMELFEPGSPESVAGMKIRRILFEEEVGTMFAWISPKGGDYEYEEARIRVGRLRKINGFMVLQSYGIPVNFDNRKVISIFTRLQEFSDKKSQYPRDAEDLRDKIVIFRPPDGKNWLDFLKEDGVLPELRKEFEKIQDGTVGMFNRKARREARESVNENLYQISAQGMNEEKAIKAGAGIEGSMRKRGHSMEGGGCGILNSVLLGRNGLILNVYINNGIIFTKLYDRFGPLDFNCPCCNFINHRLPNQFIFICQNSHCPDPTAVACGMSDTKAEAFV